MQRGSHRTGAGPPFAALGAGRVIGNAEGTDTMLAWERFLTGEPGAAEPAGNFVVSSWQRSLQFGVDPTGRAAPFAARGDALHTLRRRHRDLIAAASRYIRAKWRICLPARVPSCC